MSHRCRPSLQVDRIDDRRVDAIASSESESGAEEEEGEACSRGVVLFLFKFYLFKISEIATWPGCSLLEERNLAQSKSILGCL